MSTALSFVLVLIAFLKIGETLFRGGCYEIKEEKKLENVCLNYNKSNLKFVWRIVQHLNCLPHGGKNGI